MNNFRCLICFIDAPAILNCGVTPIPGSASLPLQVVADTTSRSIGSIEYKDTTGDFIGVYIGGVGIETQIGIIGGGAPYTINVSIAPHSRISIRSITASSITNGYLVCSFMSS